MALNVYVQIDGIKGESADAAHAGWIELTSATLGSQTAKKRNRVYWWRPHRRTMRAPDIGDHKIGRSSFTAADDVFLDGKNDPKS